MKPAPRTVSVRRLPRLSRVRVLAGVAVVAVLGIAVTLLASAATAPSGVDVPKGNLNGWRQVLAEDFTNAATSSAFDKTYAGSYCGYADGTGGMYYKSVITAHDGQMDIALDGTKGAAGSFGPPATCWGGKYGRYSMRIKAVGAAGNGTAVMVWPSSNVWGDGEIDYPEGNFDGTIHVFHHGMNCADCSSSDGFDTGAAWTSWHTVTTEWTPAAVKYYLDDRLVKTVTHDVPVTDHRYTMQVAPNASKVAAGHFLIDWVAVYAYDPAATGSTPSPAATPVTTTTPVRTPLPTTTTTGTPVLTASPEPSRTPTPTPATATADINRDGRVNVLDLSALLSGWGKAGKSDLNGDGTTNVLDLSMLLSRWGS